MYIGEDGSMRLQHARELTPADVRPEITVLVIAGAYYDVFRPSVSLANVHYPINVIIVCLDPENRDEVVWFPRRYISVMPRFRVFEPEKKLTVREGMNAGLQSITTPYVFVMGSNSMVHSRAFECLTEQHLNCDWVEARRFDITRLGWVRHSVDTFKPLWKTSHVISRGGFRGEGSVTDIEQAMLNEPANAPHARLDAVLFFG
jgi:hypothetical protein